MLIQSLFERNDFENWIKEKVKEFAFQKTVSLSINSHYHNQVLIFLENNFGFDVMFSYLIKKLEFHETNNKMHLIDFSGLHGNPDNSQDQREDNLLKAVEWYVQQDDPEYVHLKLIQGFARPGVFTETFRKKIDQLIDQHGKDIKYLIKLCQSLEVFENKEGELLDFLISVADRIAKLPGYSSELLESVFGLGFIYNSGGKNKTGPGPYPKDVARHEQLTEVLKREDLHNDVREVFKLALERVDNAIARESKSDSDDW